MRNSFIGGGGRKVGANFSFSDQMHGYVHLERRSGGEIREEWRRTVGVRNCV